MADTLHHNVLHRLISYDLYVYYELYDFENIVEFSMAVFEGSYGFLVLDGRFVIRCGLLAKSCYLRFGFS